MVHTIPAPERSTSDSPSVMMSTSQCVAEMARRMMARSTRRPSSAPAPTAQPSATGSGSPRPWFADHATKAETISMSPCAKFTVCVAL